ncbi:uncharacterized protein LOC144020175 isoform X2 [Festucalex cinctus]
MNMRRRRKQLVPHPASERDTTMRTALVVLLLLTFRLAVAAVRPDCPKRQHSNLSCFNDYNRTITCVWNNSDARPDDDDDDDDDVAACSLHAERSNAPKPRRVYKSRCLLRPLDVRTPSSPRTCSLIFGKDGIFQSDHELNVSINCSDVKMPAYKPACHVKLPPPGKPEIKQTAVSWAVAKQHFMPLYDFQLEWKLAEEPWNGASVHRETELSHNESSRSELSLDQLTRGAVYEARVRVKPSKDTLESAWSDWSAAARWTSDVGEAAAPPADSLWLVLGLTVSGAAIAVFLALLVFRTDKTNWVYIFKKIRGPLLPDPGKSFLQNWANPPFTNESLQFFLQPVDILTVMSVGCMNPQDPRGPGDQWYPGGTGDPKTLLEKMIMRTTMVDFFAARNSQPWPAPVTFLTSGNLMPCAPDSPYGHVGTLADQDGEMKDARNLPLEVLGKFSQSEATPVIISDYEKVEKLQSDRSGEDEASGGRRGGVGQSPFEGTLTEASIQVSLDYECIRTHHDDGPELPSADSGIGGVSEEHGCPEESLEDGEGKTSCFPCPPDPPVCGSPLGFHSPNLEDLQALMRDATDFTRGAVKPSEMMPFISDYE